jgi:hypothetical protein
MIHHMTVKCKECGHEFSSGFQMTEANFQTSPTFVNNEHCQKCSQTASYTNDDYYFKHLS